MQIILSIIFPFSCIARLSVTKCLFGRSDSHCNSKYALLFYIVVFLFVFFPFSVKKAEAVPLTKTLQVMNKNILCPFVFIENTKEGHIKADIFSFEAVFDEMDNGLFKFRVFFFKFLSFGFNFVIPNCNEGGQQNSNNGEGNNKMLTDGVNNEIQESHFDQAVKGLGLGFLISIVFKIVWYVVNYIYAQRCG
jgi:hypothetical protein